MVKRIFSFYLAENLLLTADHKTVKLADFGLAREESLTEMMTAETGTYRWMAPEVLLSFDIFCFLFFFWVKLLISSIQLLKENNLCECFSCIALLLFD